MTDDKKLALIPAYILEAVRQNGWKDEQIAQMSGKALFGSYCNWNGLVAWGEALWTIVEVLQAYEKQAKYCKQQDEDAETKKWCMTEYQGYSNEPTWTVNLIIDNNRQLCADKFRLIKKMNSWGIPLSGARVKEFWLSRTSHVLERADVESIKEVSPMLPYVNWDEIAQNWRAE